MKRQTFFPRHPWTPLIYQLKLNERNYGANLSAGTVYVKKYDERVEQLTLADILNGLVELMANEDDRRRRRRR